MIRSLLLLTISFVFFSINTSLAQNFELAERPDWSITETEKVKSKVTRYNVQSGAYIAESVTVYHYEKEQTFASVTSKIINNSGIENLSQIYIPFDTSYQSIQFHSFVIERNGKKVDKTSELEFNIINSENDLAANVYNGVMAVHAIVDDLRKEDLMTISYSVIGINPLHKGHLHDIYYLQDVNPIDYFKFKIISSSDFEFSYKVDSEENINIKENEKDGIKTVEIVGKHIEPFVLEEFMSASSVVGNRIQISSFKNWNEVSAWGMNLFANSENNAIEEAISEITNSKDDLISKATAIVDFVQNDIRYTSVNGGIGSLKPSSPNEVLDRRYGDCKDKTLLLVEMLRKIGVEEAYPVLVNSGGGKFLNDYVEGNTLFNHVIVKTNIAGKDMWIDPTVPMQGGSILQRHSPYYGYGLVLSTATTELEEISAINYSTTTIEEVFDFSKLDEDGKLTVKTVLTGNDANSLRLMYDYYSPKEIEDLFKGVYSTIFLDVQLIGRVKITDDLDKNEMTLVEEYRIESPWQDYTFNEFTGKSFTYEPTNIYNYIAPLSCNEATFPIDVPGDVNYKQNTIFLLPDNALYQLNNFETNNPIYSFKKDQKITSITKTELNFELVMGEHLINPEQFKKVCEDINKDYRNLQLLIVKLDE